MSTSVLTKEEAVPEDAPVVEKPKCSVSWCHKTARSSGYCRQHYRRFKRSQSPVAITGDVADLLALAKEAIAIIGVQAEKLHKASKHSTAFASCQTGLCKEFHRLDAQTEGDTAHE